jgi:hypothetical protein
MLTKSKLTDKDSEEHVKNKGLDPHTKIGIIVTVNPIKQRFARPIKVQIHIPFYKKPNPFVGLETFASWESCGILRGKCLSEKEYKKLAPKEQAECHEFIVPDGTSKTREIKLYAQPKDTARTLVCKHLAGECPISELYSDKVFTQEVLRELDNNVIKKTFMLPSVESLEDLAEVAEEVEGFEMDDSNDIIGNLTKELEVNPDEY